MVSLPFRLAVAYLVLGGVGLYFLVDWVVDDVRPRYLEAMEESMVETATVLASLLSRRVEEAGISVDDLRGGFEEAQRRMFSAQIYEMTKTHVDMRVYVTDDKGVVLFDSNGGRDEGEDYSQWNDVARTLSGRYGARSTRADPDDPRTSTLHVAAPIIARRKIVGVLTVCRPAAGLLTFMEAAKRKIVIGGIVAAAAVILIGFVVAYWITRPVRRLTDYVRVVGRGERVALPNLGRNEFGTLGAAFEEMRRALEGRRYIEQYVQSLTHEMKSPLSAIRGATELLGEEMAPEQRARFLGNIRGEVERLQNLIERLLRLAEIENRGGLENVGEIDLEALVGDILESAAPQLAAGGIAVSRRSDGPAIVRGEIFLLRQAIMNLLQNAVDFAPGGGHVDIAVTTEPSSVSLSVSDDGPGIPAYAIEKIFDRFYSLPRPATGKKSSGLGLPFARAAARLHGGDVTVENLPGGGARAVIRLPR